MLIPLFGRCKRRAARAAEEHPWQGAGKVHGRGVDSLRRGLNFFPRQGWWFFFSGLLSSPSIAGLSTGRAGSALVAVLCLLLLASACSTKRSVPSTARQRPPAARQEVKKGTYKPYTVAGKTYVPLESSEGYTEEGLASWYGKEFHGRPTASGQIFDMYKASAAHKLLPMGTRLKVSNLDNSRSMEVTVNDRGPFIQGRILDLSYEAARRLGMVEEGVARVRIQSLGGVPRGPDGGLPGPFFIQVGSFGVRENADRLAAELTNRGYRGTRVVTAFLSGKTYYRVQAGEFRAQSTAALELDRLRKAYPNAFLVVGGERG